jgi:hypothetical protein
MTLTGKKRNIGDVCEILRKISRRVFVIKTGTEFK